MNADNWTTRPELIALIDDLEALAARAEAIGEKRLAAILYAVGAARTADGDELPVALKAFDSAVVTVLEAIQ